MHIMAGHRHDIPEKLLVTIRIKYCDTSAGVKTTEEFRIYSRRLARRHSNTLPIHNIA